MTDTRQISVVRIFKLLGVAFLLCVVGLIPFVRKERALAQRRLCRNTMLEINTGIESLALAYRWKRGDMLDKNAVGTTMRRGWPKCPSGPDYIVDRVGEDINCPVHGRFVCSWSKWPK